MNDGKFCKLINGIEPFLLRSEMSLDGRTEVQSNPLLERMRRLTFDENGVFRWGDHVHANAGNSWGFDTISSLYAEDSRQPGAREVPCLMELASRRIKDALPRGQLPQAVYRLPLPTIMKRHLIGDEN